MEESKNKTLIQFTNGNYWVYHLVPEWGWCKLRLATKEEIEKDKP